MSTGLSVITDVVPDHGHDTLILQPDVSGQAGILDRLTREYAVWLLDLRDMDRVHCL